MSSLRSSRIGPLFGRSLRRWTGLYPSKVLCGRSLQRCAGLLPSKSTSLSYVISGSILSIYRCVVGIESPPDKFPVPGKATYMREVARYPGEAVCDRITHCHSSHRHGSPTVGLGIFRFKVYSFRSAVWCEVVRDSFWWGFRWALLHRSSVVASWSTRSL